MKGKSIKMCYGHALSAPLEGDLLLPYLCDLPPQSVCFELDQSS